MIKWNATKAEFDIINRIAERAVKMANEHKRGSYRKMDAIMDVEACHCNGMPIDLERLLNADNFNFAHDVFGIRRHINRDTGQLENCFVPRCALPEPKPA